MDDIIAGRHPVKEALRSGRSINKIMIAGDVLTGPLQEIFATARDKKIPVQKVDRRRLEQLVSNAAHQGVVAFLAAKEYVDIEDILASVEADEEPFLIILDEISDPHNLGAILRTADAAGAHGVVIPRRRSAPLTPTVAKSSAGAIEYVKVARVTNLPQTIDQLKKKGLWIIGAAPDGGELYWESRLDGPLGMVIGAEGKGLGRLVKERCDNLVHLPMLGQVNSLNASVAAAVLAYEVLRQRRKAFIDEGVSCS
ncbi:MAG: 23S rRNA (guanosine(2251)-2'-O)-methyltransferase RlmB [Peptococcaceae bacterium]|nr:23S rRNA (guanosine(2251)-2'-O)-methyltransferase RlmB [Candidatus Syntrophopropionicum ammoniitolerans]